MSKLDILIQDLNKKYKTELITIGIPTISVEKIPFSSPRANYQTYGGLPRGRIIEFAGEENGGKTTTALDIVASAQKLFQKEWSNEVTELSELDKQTKTQAAQLALLRERGPLKVLYADCENTLDEDWADKLGVDVAELRLMKPQAQSAEEIFQMILDIIETREVGLVIIDSLGVMLSAQAYDKTVDEKTYGGISAALTLFSKKAEMLCANTNCTLIGINQLRDNLSGYGSPYNTTGGRAWKHNCSMRLMFEKGSYIDEAGNEITKRAADTPAGNLVMMSIAKTKVCKPDRRTGFYTLRYETGVDVIADTVETALKYEIIQASGSWYTFVDIATGETFLDENDETLKIQGKVNLIGYLGEYPDFFQVIYDMVMNKLKET